MPVLSTWSVQLDGHEALDTLHQDDAVLFQKLGQLIQVRYLKGHGVANVVDSDTVLPMWSIRKKIMGPTR